MGATTEEHIGAEEVAVEAVVPTAEETEARENGEKGSPEAEVAVATEPSSRERSKPPHEFARPCPFWSRHQTDKEDPCQGWVMTPYDMVCRGCSRAGRRFRPQMRITVSLVEKTFQAAIGEKDGDDRMISKGVFDRVLSEFTKTPGYERAKKAALAAVEAFKERKAPLWLIYGMVQRTVLLLLTEERRWLHEELQRVIQTDGQNRKQERLQKVEGAFRQEQERIVQAWKETRNYPPWGAFKPQRLRDLFVAYVRRAGLANRLERSLQANSIPRSRKKRMEKRQK